MRVVVPCSAAVVVVLASGCLNTPQEGGDDDGMHLTEEPGTSGGDSDADGGVGASTGDPSGGCEDACEDGAAACEGGGVARCGLGDDGCLAWMAPESCPEGQVCSDGACSAAPGFIAEPAAWAVPAGGRAGDGFAGPTGAPAVAGDDAWELVDLDGDGALDLVITATAYPSGDGFVTRTKGWPFAPFWQVHRGGGDKGFASVPVAWPLPVGLGVAERGFIATAGEPVGPKDAVWGLRDVDGDGRPDLVVTGVAGQSPNAVAPLGAPDAPRWDVYRNTGSGFATSAEAWALPQGPDAKQFHHLEGAAQGAGGPAWSLLDLDGDGWSDLVVTGRASGPRHVVPGFPDSPHWELHRGGPNGFAAGLATWAVPAGGGAQTGFAGLSGEAVAAGDSAWAVLDLDGDGRRELVVTGVLADPAVGPAALVVDGGPAWAVHRAGATGFELSPETCVLPATGGGSGGRGYHAVRGGQDIAGSVGGPYDATGWELLDLDGDGRLDLVVTSEARPAAGGVYKRAALGGDASPYWDVYFGTDAGFALATRWPTPAGGFLGRGFLWGRGPDSVPEVEGSARWQTGDLDGDGRPELVVTALSAPSPWAWRVPGLDAGAPRWQVHWQWARQ